MAIRRTSSLDDQRGIYPFFGVKRPFDPECKFVTARFISPKVFGLLRLLIAIYCVVTVIVDIVLTGLSLALPSSLCSIGLTSSHHRQNRFLFQLFHRHNLHFLDILLSLRSMSYTLVCSYRRIASQHMVSAISTRSYGAVYHDHYLSDSGDDCVLVAAGGKWDSCYDAIEVE